VTRPLQIFGALGLATFLPGIAMMGYLAMTKLVASQPIGGRPLLWFGFLFIVAGVQFLTLGLLAELQTRIYHESQDKPTYVVREVRETTLPVQSPETPRESQLPSLDPSPLTTLEFQD
jgi:hypothetical protein